MLPVSRRLLPVTGALFRAAAATPRFPFSSTPSFVANPTLARCRTFATTSTTEGSDPDFAPKSKVEPTEDVQDKINKVVHDNRVVLFMKGSPAAPKCGFSKAVCAVLSAEGLNDFTYVDVLKSDAVREGIKKYSDWPTIPQLYVDGEFLGGYDIISSMYREGELKEMIADKGLKGSKEE
ncbi:hypothetical protein FOZ63_015358 [Perkinsus olseni]|uniref:Glutaredoxin domain-containing protein n=1 Tax=Perkinsus olseni TaxID=32597 RepID=A0A7J6TC95_PEROL|nr:hypothetical protein FOZ62_026027 [Perkinsus olseni]KAF4741980.1 hypothetical protein FOZ63_015358 [Perkinsus olseni]